MPAETAGRERRLLSLGLSTNIAVWANARTTAQERCADADPGRLPACAGSGSTAVSFMVFRNYGGIFQLRLETADDLACLQRLEEPRWAATSAPVGCFRCDPEVLRCLDPEATGRIHTQDMKDAQKRLFRFLANREGVSQGSDTLRLAHLDISHAEGRKLKETAEWMLSRLDAKASDEVSLEQIRAFRKGSAAAFPNGDGIVPLEDIPDQQTRAFCADVVRYAGAATDAAGKIGYSQEQLDAFLERARTMREWMVQGGPPAEADQRASELLKWGDRKSVV